MAELARQVFGTMTQGRSLQLQGHLGTGSFMIAFAVVGCGLAYQLLITKFMLRSQAEVHQEVRKEKTQTSACQM